MANDKTVGVLILAFVIAIVGVTLASQLANSQTAATQLNTVNNETAALVNGTAVKLLNNQLSSITTVYNATNATDIIATANYTANLDQGTITLINSRTGNFNITYTYYKVKDSTARTIITLMVLFFCIAVLVMTVAVLNPTFREMLEGLGKY